MQSGFVCPICTWKLQMPPRHSLRGQVVTTSSLHFSSLSSAELILILPLEIPDVPRSIVRLFFTHCVDSMTDVVAHLPYSIQPHDRHDFPYPICNTSLHKGLPTSLTAMAEYKRMIKYEKQRLHTTRQQRKMGDNQHSTG